MSSESDDDGQIAYRLRLRVAHPLHQNHALAFINSLDTLQRQFSLSLQENTNISISQIIFRSSGLFNCDGCGVPYSGPSYHCLECQFGLDAECAQLPVVTVEGHPHHLLLLKGKPDHQDLICAVCDEEITVPTFIRCVQCDAFLHAQCALPPTIIIKNHPHHIVLSSPESVDNDSGPRFCGVCEEERDSISWVYSCAICKFVADVRCVIYEYEVPSVIETELAIVNQLWMLELDERKTDEDQVEGQESQEIELKPGVTLQQILDSFSEAEGAEYETIGAAVVRDVGEDEDDGETDSEDKYFNHFSYLEKPLYDLLNKLELEEDSENPFEGLDMDSPTVLVGQYLATQNMADTLASVLAKHGDITGTSNLSTKVKIMVCNLFCKVIHDMSKTEFSSVTEKLLFSWMFGIRTIQLTGFDVQFAFDHWKKVALAFFGLQGQYMADSLLAEMDQEINEQSLKLQTLCGKREELVNLTEECLKEAQAMEGKTAGDGLI